MQAAEEVPRPLAEVCAERAYLKHLDFRMEIQSA